MEFAALRKKKDNGTNGYRTQVSIKPEQPENMGQPWQNNRSDLQAGYRHNTGWKEANNEPDRRESGNIPS